MTTVRRVGDACEAAKAPGLCGCAVGKDDVLIVMMYTNDELDVIYSQAA